MSHLKCACEKLKCNLHAYTIKQNKKTQNLYNVHFKTLLYIIIKKLNHITIYQSI